MREPVLLVRVGHLHNGIDRLSIKLWVGQYAFSGGRAAADPQRRVDHDLQKHTHTPNRKIKVVKNPPLDMEREEGRTLTFPVILLSMSFSNLGSFSKAVASTRCLLC